MIEHTTWTHVLFTTVLSLGVIVVLLLLESACTFVRKANRELEAQWDQTLERLSTWACLKASDDMVIERCGA